MGDKMECGDSSYCCDMPMEVLIEILIFLPLKSLIRFTIVCKSWLHLIRNNPQFSLRHYLTRTRSSSSSLMDNVDYIVDYFGPYGRGCNSTTNEVLRLCIHSVTEKKTFRLVKKLEFGPRLDVCASNFCHGITCVHVSSSGRGARMLLCNPAIGEVVPLPLSHNIATRGFSKFGLGYDPINNNYKIVAAYPPSFFGCSNSWQVDVYCVRDGRWHSVHATGPLEQFQSLEGPPTLNADGRVLNWLGYLKSTDSVKALMSFDMVDEVFREVIMPECLYPNSWRQHHILTSSGCLACLCCSSYPSFDLREIDEHFNGVDLWVLNRVDEQMLWKKQFSFTFPGEEVAVWPVPLWMNDNELFVHVRKQGGSTEEVYHYDRFTHQLKRTGRLGTLMNPDGYTESLISIKSLISSPYHQAAGDEEQKDDVCFIREFGRKNNDIRWSYNFTLV